MSSISHMFKFLSEFAKHPRTTGAIAPSSAGLARAMVREAGLAGARAVIEYGPGTGVFTEEILRALPEGAKFFAIERNAELAAMVRRRLPQVRLVEGCVSEVEQFAAGEGIERADAIVSGLPWAGFDAELQRMLMEPALRILKPGGRFVTFAYLHALNFPAGRRFRRFLHEHFDSVSMSRPVWLNLPPALVYRCVKK